jgi:hypothetical protein
VRVSEEKKKRGVRWPVSERQTEVSRVSRMEWRFMAVVVLLSAQESASQRTGRPPSPAPSHAPSPNPGAGSVGAARIVKG